MISLCQGKKNNNFFGSIFLQNKRKNQPQIQQTNPRKKLKVTETVPLEDHDELELENSQPLTQIHKNSQHLTQIQTQNLTQIQINSPAKIDPLTFMMQQNQHLQRNFFAQKQKDNEIQIQFLKQQQQFQQSMFALLNSRKN